MNGYSKMRANTPNSKSMDFSNLNFSPPKTQQDPCNNNYSSPSNKPHQDEEFEGERFGVMLSRNCSPASQRFRENSNNNNEKSNGIIGGVVRRAFSMRKPSSLAGDGYWRIHDTGDQVMIEEEEDQEKRTTSIKKKRGRIFRACKRFFKYF